MAKGKKTGGRRPGSTNKVTADLRDMVLSSLDAVGGQAYLERQALENPGPYLALVSKVLPKEIKADVNLKVAPGMCMILK